MPVQWDLQMLHLPVHPLYCQLGAEDLQIWRRLIMVGNLASPLPQNYLCQWTIYSLLFCWWHKMCSAWSEFFLFCKLKGITSLKFVFPCKKPRRSQRIECREQVEHKAKSIQDGPLGYLEILPLELKFLIFTYLPGKEYLNIWGVSNSMTIRQPICKSVNHQSINQQSPRNSPVQGPRPTNTCRTGKIPLYYHV